MDHRRKGERLFDYAVLLCLVVIFTTIIEVMSRPTVKPEVLTVLGSALGVDLGLIGLAAAHLWNKQKNDGAADRKTPPPNTTMEATSTVTTKTVAAAEDQSKA